MDWSDYRTLLYIIYLKLGSPSFSPNFLQFQSSIFILYLKSNIRNGCPLIIEDMKYNFVLGNIKFNALESKRKWGSRFLPMHGIW